MTNKIKNKILVVNGENYANAITGLGNIVFGIEDFLLNTMEYCLVMFTGGADVSPSYYHDVSPLGLCYTNPKRDEQEAIIFEHALKNSIKMTGICRGAQFINVMSGGSLMHDISGHAGGNHNFESSKDEVIFQVTSTHHQMIVPPEDGLVLGWSPEKLSRRYIGTADIRTNYTGPEVEAVLIPRTKCCGVQYHPEFMVNTSKGYTFYHTLVQDLINMSIDAFTNKYTRRVKQYVQLVST